MFAFQNDEIMKSYHAYYREHGYADAILMTCRDYKMTPEELQEHALDLFMDSEIGQVLAEKKRAEVIAAVEQGLDLEKL